MLSLIVPGLRALPVPSARPLPPALFRSCSAVRPLRTDGTAQADVCLPVSRDWARGGCCLVSSGGVCPVQMFKTRWERRRCPAYVGRLLPKAAIPSCGGSRLGLPFCDPSVPERTHRGTRETGLPWCPRLARLRCRILSHVRHTHSFKRLLLFNRNLEASLAFPRFSLPWVTESITSWSVPYFVCGSPSRGLMGEAESVVLSPNRWTSGERRAFRLSAAGTSSAACGCGALCGAARAGSATGRRVSS